MLFNPFCTAEKMSLKNFYGHLPPRLDVLSFVTYNQFPLKPGNRNLFTNHKTPLKKALKPNAFYPCVKK